MDRAAWTHAIAVDGWEMLSVVLIIECLVEVASVKHKMMPPTPPPVIIFAAVMALLINHHKLHPWLQSCV